MEKIDTEASVSLSLLRVESDYGSLFRSLYLYSAYGLYFPGTVETNLLRGAGNHCRSRNESGNEQIRDFHN